MAQPYGATDYPRIDVEARDETSSEDTPLLGVSKTGKETTVKKGHATLVSSIGNFTNTIVGSGKSYLCAIPALLLTYRCRSPQSPTGMNPSRR